MKEKDFIIDNETGEVEEVKEKPHYSLKELNELAAIDPSLISEEDYRPYTMEDLEYIRAGLDIKDGYYPFTLEELNGEDPLSRMSMRSMSTMRTINTLASSPMGFRIELEDDETGQIIRDGGTIHHLKKYWVNVYLTGVLDEDIEFLEVTTSIGSPTNGSHFWTETKTIRGWGNFHTLDGDSFTPASDGGVMLTPVTYDEKLSGNIVMGANTATTIFSYFRSDGSKQARIKDGLLARFSVVPSSKNTSFNNTSGASFYINARMEYTNLPLESFNNSRIISLNVIGSANSINENRLRKLYVNGKEVIADFLNETNIEFDLEDGEFVEEIKGIGILPNRDQPTFLPDIYSENIQLSYKPFTYEAKVYNLKFNNWTFSGLGPLEFSIDYEDVKTGEMFYDGDTVRFGREYIMRLRLDRMPMFGIKKINLEIRNYSYRMHHRVIQDGGVLRHGKAFELTSKGGVLKTPLISSDTSSFTARLVRAGGESSLSLAIAAENFYVRFESSDTRVAKFGHGVLAEIPIVVSSYSGYHGVAVASNHELRDTNITYEDDTTETISRKQVSRFPLALDDPDTGHLTGNNNLRWLKVNGVNIEGDFVNQSNFTYTLSKNEKVNSVEAIGMDYRPEMINISDITQPVIIIESGTRTNQKTYTLTIEEWAGQSSALLKDIKINNKSLEDFDMDTFRYTYRVPYGQTINTVEAIPMTEGAVVEISQPDVIVNGSVIAIQVINGQDSEYYFIDIELVEKPPKFSLKLIDFNAEENPGDFGTTPIANGSNIQREQRFQVDVNLEELREGIDLSTIDLRIEYNPDLISPLFSEDNEVPGEKNVLMVPDKITMSNFFPVPDDMDADRYWTQKGIVYDNNPGQLNLLFQGQGKNNPLLAKSGKVISLFFMVKADAAIGQAINIDYIVSGIQKSLVRSEQPEFIGQNISIEGVNAFANVYKKVNDSNLLRDITIKGVSIPGFKPTTKDYDRLVLKSEQDLPFEILGIPESEDATVSIATYTLKPRGYIYPVAITVTSWSGKRNTYTVRVNNPDYRTTLESLTIDGYNIEGFEPNKFDYICVVDDDMEGVIEAVPASHQAEAVITKSGKIKDGSTAKIVVTGYDETTSEYNIVFTNNSSLLKSISINTKKVKDFDPIVSNHRYTMDELETFESLIVEAIPESATAIVSVEKLDGVITIKVNNYSGVESIYTVETITYSNSALLESLSVNGYLVEDWDSNRLEYNYLVEEGIPIREVIGVPLSPDAKVSVRIPADPSTIKDGYVIEVTVRGASGNTNVYKIEVRSPDYSTYLKSLTVNSKLIRFFNKEIQVYDYRMKEGQTFLTVVGEAESKDSTVEVIYPDELIDTSFIITRVTAFNGRTRDYVIHVERIDYSNKLRDLLVDGVTIEGFDPDRNSYNITIDSDNRGLRFDAYPESPVANMLIRRPDVIIDNTRVEVEVTSYSGKVNTYTIVIAVKDNAAKLSDIFVNSQRLPSFDPNRNNYTYTWYIDEESSLTFNAITLSPDAYFNITKPSPIKDGSVVTIKVVSYTGMLNYYTIKIVVVRGEYPAYDPGKTGFLDNVNDIIITRKEFIDYDLEMLDKNYKKFITMGNKNYKPQLVIEQTTREARLEGFDYLDGVNSGSVKAVSIKGLGDTKYSTNITSSGVGFLSSKSVNTNKIDIEFYIEDTRYRNLFVSTLMRLLNMRDKEDLVIERKEGNGTLQFNVVLDSLKFDRANLSSSVVVSFQRTDEFMVQSTQRVKRYSNEEVFMMKENHYDIVRIPIRSESGSIGFNISKYIRKAGSDDDRIYKPDNFHELSDYITINSGESSAGSYEYIEVDFGNKEVNKFNNNILREKDKQDLVYVFNNIATDLSDGSYSLKDHDFSYKFSSNGRINNIDGEPIELIANADYGRIIGLIESNTLRPTSITLSGDEFEIIVKEVKRWKV